MSLQGSTSRPSPNRSQEPDKERKRSKSAKGKRHSRRYLEARAEGRRIIKEAGGSIKNRALRGLMSVASVEEGAMDGPPSPGGIQLVVD